MRCTQQSCAVVARIVNGRLVRPAMLLQFAGVWRGESPDLFDGRCQGRQVFRETVEPGCRLGLRLSTAGHGEENSSCARAALDCLWLIAVPPWWKRMNGCHHSVHKSDNQQGGAMRPTQHISTTYLLQTLWWPHATTELGQGTKELARFEVTCKSRKHDICVDSASLLGGCRVRCLRLQKGGR